MTPYKKFCFFKNAGASTPKTLLKSKNKSKNTSLVLQEKTKINKKQQSCFFEYLLLKALPSYPEPLRGSEDHKTHQRFASKSNYVKELLQCQPFCYYFKRIYYPKKNYKNYFFYIFSLNSECQKRKKTLKKDKLLFFKDTIKDFEYFKGYNITNFSLLEEKFFGQAYLKKHSTINVKLYKTLKNTHINTLIYKIRFYLLTFLSKTKKTNITKKTLNSIHYYLIKKLIKKNVKIPCFILVNYLNMHIRFIRFFSLFPIKKIFSKLSIADAKTSKQLFISIKSYFFKHKKLKRISLVKNNKLTLLDFLSTIKYNVLDLNDQSKVSLKQKNITDYLDPLKTLFINYPLCLVRKQPSQILLSKNQQIQKIVRLDTKNKKQKLKKFDIKNFFCAYNSRGQRPRELQQKFINHNALKSILWQWNKKNQNKNPLYSIFKKYWLIIDSFYFFVKSRFQSRGQSSLKIKEIFIYLPLKEKKSSIFFFRNQLKKKYIFTEASSPKKLFVRSCFFRGLRPFDPSRYKFFSVVKNNLETRKTFLLYSTQSIARNVKQYYYPLVATLPEVDQKAKFFRGLRPRDEKKDFFLFIKKNTYTRTAKRQHPGQRFELNRSNFLDTFCLEIKISCINKTNSFMTKNLKCLLKKITMRGLCPLKKVYIETNFLNILL